MLVVDPAKRISTSDILAHPWLRDDGVNSDNVEVKNGAGFGFVTGTGKVRIQYFFDEGCAPVTVQMMLVVGLP